MAEVPRASTARLFECLIDESTPRDASYAKIATNGATIYTPAPRPPKTVKP